MRVLLVVCLLFLAFCGAWEAFRSDEVWSVLAATQPQTKMMQELRSDIHPPLYYELLAGWVRLTGTSEFAVRSLSGIFFLLASFALYRFSERYYGSTVALFAVAAYAASPLALIAAQFARMYSLVSLLSILSTWAFLDLQTRPGKRSILIYGLVSALGTFAHIWFFFLLFAQGVCALIWYRERLARFAIGAALALAPYAVLWLPVLLAQISKSSEATAWIKPPNPEELGATLLLHFGLLMVLLPIPILAPREARVQHPAPVVLPRHLLPVMLLVTILTPLLISFVKPIYYSRFTIVGLHLTSLWAATLLARTPRLILVIVLLGFSVVGVAVAARPSPADASGTANFLNSHATDGDVIIFTSLTRLPVNYYLRKIGFNQKVLATSFPAAIDTHPGYEGKITDPDRVPQYAAEADTLLQQIRSDHAGRKVYFLYGFRPGVDEVLLQRLKSQLQPLPTEGFHHGQRAFYYTDLNVYAVKP